MTYTDPIQVVRAYAPVGASADVDADFDQLWQRIDAAPSSAFRVRHRTITAIGAAAAISFGGVAVAAAAGVPLPSDVRQLFSGVTDRSGHALADPSTAKRVFAIPGPEGTTFEGWTATNSRGGLCVTTTFEPDTDASPPKDITTGGGQCADAHAPRGLFAEGTGNSFDPGTHDRADFVWEAGDAVRAELRVTTGHVYPVYIQDGWLGGWYGLDEIPVGADATIVTYAADGSVLQTVNALDQRDCPDPAQPC